MTSRHLIDAQFDRAVEIIQSLPKAGPIQTGYDEKLTMYSLYKQATVGNVKSPRPGIFDMLGRAKWDAWAKHKDLDSYEAKWLYVDALLKVLRKYSDEPMARDLSQEIESFGGDPANLVKSGQFTSSRGSVSSGSTASDRSPDRFVSPPPLRPSSAYDAPAPHPNDESSEEEEYDPSPRMTSPPVMRPGSTSSASMNRYRQPLGALTNQYTPPPPPPSQPIPGYETPSTYADSAMAAVMPSRLPHSSPPYGSAGSAAQRVLASRPGSRENLERAIENVQAHLAALHERLDALEAGSAPRIPRPTLEAGAPARKQGSDDWDFDLEDLGLWSMVFSPVNNVGMTIRQFIRFMFAASVKRSPVLVVFRRLALDVSFIFTVLYIVRSVWKNTGVRRREVRKALKILGHALFGKTQILIETGDYNS